MKDKICKRTTRKITDDIEEEYELRVENGAYTILCTEYNKKKNETAYEKAESITKSKRFAKRLYRLLVKNKACIGTINDIISDQMC